MLRPVSNPPNPWATTHVEWLVEPPVQGLRVFEEEAKEILAENDSPDLDFRWSLNPYRGCVHACAYCYARPTHQYLGFGAGTDFDLSIVVKTNAAEALRRAFHRPGWRGELIVFSGNTDCYQPLEASYGLTRACLEVCLDFRNPVAVITKGSVVRRDVGLLAALQRDAHVEVFVSIPIADDAVARVIEPGASLTSQRFATLRMLSDAGLTTGISVAPVIPGITDRDLPELLERARDAGAQRASMTLLRLPAEVEPVFRERLVAGLPGRANAILSAFSDMRGGRTHGLGFGERQRGEGPRWEMVRQMFATSCRRLGLQTGHDREPRGRSTFRRAEQRRLF